MEAWLTSHGVDLTQAANLADYLSFYYYDQETGAAIRRWDLMDQGVYSRDATGNVSRYVYSLSPNQIEGEMKASRSGSSSQMTATSSLPTTSEWKRAL